MSKVSQILGITYTIASKCQKCQKCSDGELDEMAKSRLLGGVVKSVKSVTNIGKYYYYSLF